MFLVGISTKNVSENVSSQKKTQFFSRDDTQRISRSMTCNHRQSIREKCSGFFLVWCTGWVKEQQTIFFFFLFNIVSRVPSRLILCWMPIRAMECTQWTNSCMYGRRSGASKAKALQLSACTVVVVVCCFSHSAHWLPTRKNYFTRWPIPLVVCIIM